MRKILYYDCSVGIAGDMNLGALVDLGVPVEYVREGLSLLGLDEPLEFDVWEEERAGIKGKRIKVRGVEEWVEDDAEGSHPHEGDHGHAGHTHAEGAAHGHGHAPHVHHDEGHSHHGQGSAHHHHHEHRTFREIAALIERSGLSEGVKRRALAIFRTIAEAEAKVHGSTPEEVHFHEVGAKDALVDVVGAALALEYLGVDEVWASPVQLGGGWVRCAHGVLPVPAPATAEIVKGMPVRMGLVERELTTPTGAAILAAVVDRFVERPAFVPLRVGYGVGTRRLSVPNVLRAYLGEASGELARTEQVVVSCTVDDMLPEDVSRAVDVLLEAGARDVVVRPVIMKRGRPGHEVSVLADQALAERMVQLLLRHTTTFGCRLHRVEKVELERSFEEVQTPYGTFRLKRASLGGDPSSVKWEYRDLEESSRRTGIPIPRLRALLGRYLADAYGQEGDGRL